jgi:hypothetical protein
MMTRIAQPKLAASAEEARKPIRRGEAEHAKRVELVQTYHLSPEK